jgi:hypothetical protein
MKMAAAYFVVRTRMGFNRIDAFAMLVAAFVIAPVAWWIADRTPPVDILEYTIFPPKVQAGQTVYRVLKVDRHRLCEVDPDTVIIDGAKVRWQFEELPILAPGSIGIDEYKRPVVIPLQAASGQAEMRTSATYICNPIHRIWPIKVIGKPLKFEIIGL